MVSRYDRKIVAFVIRNTFKNGRRLKRPDYVSGNIRERFTSAEPSVRRFPGY